MDRFRELTKLLDRAREAKLGLDWQSKIQLDQLERKILSELQGYAKVSQKTA